MRLQADCLRFGAAGSSEEAADNLRVDRTEVVADTTDDLAVGTKRFDEPGYPGIVEVRCIHVAVGIVHRIAHLAVPPHCESFAEV
jgi:hypothetical protein